MYEQDKIRSLWLVLEMTFNELEEMGEDPHMPGGGPIVSGESAELTFDPDDKQWKATTRP